MGQRIVYAVTLPVTAKILLRGQLAFMRERGFDVVVVTSPGPDVDVVRERENVEVVTIPLAREIDPRRDLVGLARMTETLRRLSPDLVNASTPKAGLLGMLAARALRVPARLYLMRGLRLETERGLKRRVLGVTERIAARCAHEVVCVSPSLMSRVVDAGYVPRDKACVLGQGSSNGVEPDRFTPTPERRAAGRAVRRELGLADDALVIGFVGRPVRDKGLRELLDAFDLIFDKHPSARLVLLGADMAGDDVDPMVRERAKDDARVRILGRVDDPSAHYAAMDVLAFPSFREGFPNVPLEAAAAELPVVGFRATGVVDAVADGETGAVVPMKDVPAFAAALDRYLSDPELRRAHGAAGAARVRRWFSREVVWAGWERHFRRMLDRARRG